MARMLAGAFREFDADDSASVAVLHGAGGHFCAGADLKSLAVSDIHEVDSDPAKDGPLGCTRMSLSKPVIASVGGYGCMGVGGYGCMGVWGSASYERGAIRSNASSNSGL